MDVCIVTGAAGLVGSESVKFYCDKGYTVVGIDNNLREYFFGTSTDSIKQRLLHEFDDTYIHYPVDIRNKKLLEEIFTKYASRVKCIIHSAGQPSSEWAAKEPHTDFEINALATLNLLELARKYCRSASFIFMSSNKVYGDNPNRLSVVEKDMRYEVEGDGIDESMSVDKCKHSLFGVSKLSADLMVQEYGRYFGMNTVVFRAGCISGPNHQGAELHGFLSYIIRCIMEKKSYSIFGYKGKQVRDTIHSYDLVNAFWNYHMNPTPAAVYNIGGGRENSLSIVETIDKVNKMLGTDWHDYTYLEDRSGDHIWYITNYSKFATKYPEWKLRYSIDRIMKDIICSLSTRSITAVMKGGVGNQMFQIAMAYSISRSLNMNLKFIKNQFAGCNQGYHPSNYYKSLFTRLTFVDSLTIDQTIPEKKWTQYPVIEDVKDAIQTSTNCTVSLDGYYQSEINFGEYSHEIKELFTPPLGIVGHLEKYSNLFEKFPELKGDHDYGFIGVRRGDYITHATFHNPCGMDFYTKGMNMLNKERYYIISDDYDWVKKNFVGDKFRYLELKGDLLELLSCALFKSYIISNSSFYWWGSFLSVHENTRIVAADKWMFGANAAREEYWSIYRDCMEIVERKIETN